MTVKQGTIGSANVVFTYDGSVKQTQIDVKYDAADYVSRLGIQVTDSKGNALKEGTDYEVTVKNNKGDVVDSAVDVDTYTVTVSSDTYELGGSVSGVESIKINIESLELTAANTRVTFPTAITYNDPVWNNKTQKFDDNYVTFVPYTGEDIVPVVEVAYTTDEDGDPVWTTLDAALYDLAFGYDADLDGKFDGSASRPEAINKVGRYSVAFQIDPADTKNVYTEKLVWDNNDSEGFTVTDKVKVFVDVPNTEYYAQSVYTAVNEGYVEGMGGTDLFMPNKSMSRAEMVCVLYRMAGGTAQGEDWVASPNDKTYLSKFSDVKGDEFFAQALAWAAKAGVVTGYEDGSFGPADDVTVEQYVTMLARYAKVVGNYEAVDTDEVLAGVADGSQVSEFGQDAVAWAVESGYLAQGGADIQPQSPVTRGRAVTIAVRYQPEKADLIIK